MNGDNLTTVERNGTRVEPADEQSEARAEAASLLSQQLNGTNFQWQRARLSFAPNAANNWRLRNLENGTLRLCDEQRRELVGLNLSAGNLEQ